jgi:poly-gamma-glutamate capsule biosynthesis protein CapA/YwtB (metallophosphatase superfamily)
MDKLTLWLAGDVMTGRGIDQIQGQPGDPVLYESLVRDARDYVKLAEEVNGPVPTPVAPDYIWGEALAEIERRQPDVRLVNLETAITSSGLPWPGKGVHYRMHPANIGCLSAARIACCALANNHVLDWGTTGLTQTLHTLRKAGIQTAGAGNTSDAALAPAVLPLADGARLLVFAWATSDSGVPTEWRATTERPGIALLPDLTEVSAQRVAAQVTRHRRNGDRVVVSLHWGGNWGAEVPQLHRQFAQRLIELGAADLVHGHSSHHPRPIEVYRSKLILYGCGDLINDYEGITSHGRFDPSAVCLYFAQLSFETGELLQLEIVPMQLHRLRLVRANTAARRSLQSLFDAEGRHFHTSVQAQGDGSWQLRW